jgi:guanylate kinase
MSPINIKRRGLMFILSSPSGVGKTTLVNMVREHDSHVKTSISVTTRPVRPGEINGVHYHFVTREQFNEMVKAGEFLEHAEVFGNLYGTPRRPVEDMMASGMDVIFDIDWQGNRRLTSMAREDVCSVFLLPPSKQEILNRVIKRGQEDMETIKYRLERADIEISHWHEYDYIIINRDLQESFSKIMSILRAERLKKARRTGLIKFVEGLLDEEVKF